MSLRSIEENSIFDASSTAFVHAVSDLRPLVTISIVLELGEIIPSLLSSDPSRECVKEFVYVCQRMASAYLRVKVNSGRLDPNAFGISLDDLALDCIAELFERRANGQFIELVDYYGSLNHSSFSETEWLGATRRLVFSKVNEGLFRLYKENDRSLSNVIRNLKHALRFSHSLFPVVRSNEVWIQLLEPESFPEGLPLLPSELIEARLLAESGHRRNFREFLDVFADILREQDLYQKQFPLVGLALIFRTLRVRTMPILDELNAETPQFTDEEVRRLLGLSVNRMKASMRSTYVDRGKLDEQTYDAYFDCVGDILESEYILDDGMDRTYFELLRSRMGNLNEMQYRKLHRIYLEYLAKLTRKDFLKSIENELKL